MKTVHVLDQPDEMSVKEGKEGHLFPAPLGRWAGPLEVEAPQTIVHPSNVEPARNTK